MDMAGNVWEWTSGWYFPYPDNHYKSEMFGETLKVMRGGSWNSNMDLARTAIRGKALPDQRQSYIGFRCIKRS
jgi:iron(II)-dependent oxidoreductase